MPSKMQCTSPNRRCKVRGRALRAAAEADAGAQVTKWRGKWRASAGGFDAPKHDFDFGWCATDTRLLRAGSLIRANKIVADNL